MIHEGVGVALRHITACGRLREQPLPVPAPSLARLRIPKTTAKRPRSPAQHRVPCFDRLPSLALGTFAPFRGVFMDHSGQALPCDKSETLLPMLIAFGTDSILVTYAVAMPLVVPGARRRLPGTGAVE